MIGNFIVNDLRSESEENIRIRYQHVKEFKSKNRHFPFKFQPARIQNIWCQYAILKKDNQAYGIRIQNIF